MPDAEQLRRFFRTAEARFAELRVRLAAAHPKLARGRVWCRACGRSERANVAQCLRTGWPRCCGATMTIDAPEERE